MSRKWIACILAVVVVLSLVGCSGKSDTVVYVQNVGQIAGGAIAMGNQYAGLVTSEDPVEIHKDPGKIVSETYVKAGDSVQKGTVLFEYDSEALSVQQSKQELELERLKNNVSTLKAQISQLEKEQKKASKDDQLKYTVEIQDRQAQLKEAEYNTKLKQKEIEKTKTDLRNAKVSAPSAGRVSAVNENGDGSSAYIVIQQTGSFRIKGTVNELNISDLQVGQNMIISSRSDASVQWNGTITKIDMESPNQSSNNDMMGGMMGGGSSNPMTSSSSYVFYVEPEHTEGMMLGQHVFMQVGTAAEEEKAGLWLPDYFISSTEEGESYVWAESEKGTLEKRIVTTGSYDEMDFSYEILEGLTEQDYIAFPSDYCKEGVKTTRNAADEVLPTESGTETLPLEDPSGGMMDDDFDEDIPASEAGQDGVPGEDDGVMEPSSNDNLSGGNTNGGGTSSSGNMVEDPPSWSTASFGDLVEE